MKEKERKKAGKGRFTPLQMLAAVLLTVAVTLGAVCLAAWLTIGREGLTLLEGMGLVHTLYVGEYEREKLLDSAMEGMVEGMGDRWSYYMDEEGYQNQQRNRANAYVGIGVTVSYEREEGLLIRSVAEEGPAQQAGLAPGEVICGVDGTSLAGEGRYDGSQLIQGEEGTVVSLEVISADGTLRTVDIVRARVEENPVEWELLEGSVGLITVKNFYTNSYERFRQAVEALQEKGATALVFDMRNNPGGYLDQLTNMLDLLLPEGPIFRSRNKAGEEKVTESDAACVELPMAVLVNGNTYSAAEFFAAELQEQGWAVIVGTPTTGKGYSQQSFPLPNGGAINISTQSYFTGSGVSLIGTGLTLDQEVDLSEEKGSLLQSGVLEPGEDDQLQAALELLRQ